MESLHLIQLVNGAFTETYRVEHLNLEKVNSPSHNIQPNKPSPDQLKLVHGGLNASYRERICGEAMKEELAAGQSDLHLLVAGGLSQEYRIATLGQAETAPEASSEAKTDRDLRQIALIHGGLSDEYRKKSCGHPPKREFKKSEARNSIFAPFRARLGI
ncbi:unnamed protein product [Oikopleura dioica]|uniref:Uncharacterized protein n=1 Tax=Oikopleura dioica TaxID=34765 RepID=E4Y625_OIKDI|nr:unnamed protein product [Oikopleura dioica]